MTIGGTVPATRPRSDGSGRWAVAAQLFAALGFGRGGGGIERSAPDPWPGDPAEADRLFQGRYCFAGEEAVKVGHAPWTGDTPSRAWASEAHGFSWLRHLRAAGGEAARRQARALVADWLNACPDRNAIAWRPPVVARRLIAWLGHAEFMLRGADPAWRAALVAAVADHARHLRRLRRRLGPGDGRLLAALGLCHAVLCLDGRGWRWRQAARSLARALADEILADGGCRWRNPALQMAVLRDLITLREVCAGVAIAPPPALADAIGLMAAMLRFFRHGDGGLALFHGATEETSDAVALTLVLAGLPDGPPDSAAKSGFERLQAGSSVLLMDAGLPPPAMADTWPHASPLAFEFSAGSDRLIVNCGAPRHHREDWRRAMASTAAHSTLTIAGEDAVERTGRGSVLPAPLVARGVAAEGVWLSASHDFYRRRFGITHRRRLVLHPSGADLGGEDAMIGPGLSPVASGQFALRFHLHPTVDASPGPDAATVRLAAGGRVWHFQFAGGAPEVAEGIYFGRDGAARRSRQIVISGPLAPDRAVVSWRLSALGASA